MDTSRLFDCNCKVCDHVGGAGIPSQPPITWLARCIHRHGGCKRVTTLPDISHRGTRGASKHGWLCLATMIMFMPLCAKLFASVPAKVHTNGRGKEASNVTCYTLALYIYWHPYILRPPGQCANLALPLHCRRRLG